MKSLKFVLLLGVVGAIGLNGCKPDGIVRVDLKKMTFIGNVDERFQSFNIEMVEIIGGDFWIPYDQMEAAGKKDMTSIEDVGQDEDLYHVISPIRLYDKKLRTLAAALSPMYLRVSGTWANSVYFQDNNQPTIKPAPQGFNNVLTRKKWKGVVDFSNAIDAKIVTSFAISDGVRDGSGIWTPTEAIKIVNYTTFLKGEIAAAELFNEPNLASMSGPPEGYDATKFAKDSQAFRKFFKANLPNTILLGPGNVVEGAFELPPEMISIPTEEMFRAEPKLEFDVFSYHYYGAISQRCAGTESSPVSTSADQALTEDWLNRTVKAAEFYKGFRDKYLPGKPMWVTETADALCGGNPWAATYLDCFRYLEQLGRLAKQGIQVVMHNTLTASNYCLLDQDTHSPKPNYWAALLWAKLMGTKVYDAAASVPGVNVYAHNLKGQKGIALLIINTRDTEAPVEIPLKAMRYTLTSKELQGKTVMLNGKELVLGIDDSLPSIIGKRMKAGLVKLPPTSISFITFIF